MTHTVIRLDKAWTQETEKGFYVKAMDKNGKVFFLKRVLKNMYDFVPAQELASPYKEETADRHVTDITRNISRGRYNTYLLTDDRVQARRMFVMLIDEKIYGGVFDRASKAEKAVKAFNEAEKGHRATYIDVTEQINRPLR